MKFRLDCTEWVGRKPCRLQSKQGLEDCEGCRFYQRATASSSPARKQPYSRSVLESARSVGIIRHGGLGNVLRTDAVSRGVRLVNPTAKIVWMTHQRGSELLKYVPGVTPFDMETSRIPSSLIEELDVVINFEAIEDVRSVVAASRCVAGFSINEYGKFVPASSHALRLQALQIGDNLRKKGMGTMQRVLLNSVGLDDVEPQYDLHLPVDKYEAARRIVGERSTVGLNIGTSQKGRLKRWPVSHWVQLIERLNQVAPQVRIVVLSGPEDHDIRCDFLAALSKSDATVEVLPDTLDAGTFMAIIGCLDYLVTNDTFALHVASALGTPQVAIAGPMPAQELEVRPSDKLLNTTLSCAPCYYRCIQDVKGLCMHYVSVEIVEASLLDLMREER